MCIIDKNSKARASTVPDAYMAKDQWTHWQLSALYGIKNAHCFFPNISSDLDVQDVTAIGSGTDYMVPVGVTTISTFAAGVDYVDKTINIVADELIETIEKFTVALTTPIGGVIFEPSTTTVYILDGTGMMQ